MISQFIWSINYFQIFVSKLIRQIYGRRKNIIHMNMILRSLFVSRSNYLSKVFSEIAASDLRSHCLSDILGPVVQSVVSLTSSFRVISLTLLADSIHNILIFFAEKMWVAFALHCKSYSHFFSKTFQHICVSLDANFNESLSNDVVSFEQLGPAAFNRSYPGKAKA